MIQCPPLENAFQGRRHHPSQPDGLTRANDSLRKADRIGQVILLMAIGFLMAGRVVTHEHFPFMLVADALLGLALYLFVSVRFTILKTLELRRSILVCQLVLGSCLFGLFIAFNLNLSMLFRLGLYVFR